MPIDFNEMYDTMIPLRTALILEANKMERDLFRRESENALQT